jgi:tetratricopeptide (TPR) repeat protein
VYALDNKEIALNDLGKPEEAITYLDKALEIEPSHVGALINRGWSLPIGEISRRA